MWRAGSNASYSFAELDFYACLNEFDEGVGSIIAALKRLDYYDNTMIWFTTDNGPEVNCAPEGRCGYGRSVRVCIFCEILNVCSNSQAHKIRHVMFWLSVSGRFTLGHPGTRCPPPHTHTHTHTFCSIMQGYCASESACSCMKGGLGRCYAPCQT